MIESTVGPGTHVPANSDVPDYSIKAVSNEIAVSNDGSNYITGPSAHSGPGYVSSTPSPFNPGFSPTPYPPSAFSSASPYPTPNTFISTPSTVGGIDRNYVTPTVPTLPSGGPSPLAPSGPTANESPDIIYGLLPPKEDTFYSQQYIPPTPSGPAQLHLTPNPHADHGVVHITPAPYPTRISPSPTPTVFYPTPTYLPTAEGPSQSQSPRPFSLPTPDPGNYHQPSHYPDAIIKNTSNGWFYGVPPGSSVRAHIQNIDLVPTHDRALSPGEALQRDEERDARHHQHHHHRHHRNSHPRA